MIITPYERMRDTLEVYNYLISKGCIPADCSIGLITMHKEPFQKFLNNNCNGECSKLTTKNGTLYSVWINYVKISYLDSK